MSVRRAAWGKGHCAVCALTRAPHVEHCPMAIVLIMTCKRCRAASWHRHPGRPCATLSRHGCQRWHHLVGSLMQLHASNSGVMRAESSLPAHVSMYTMAKS